MPVVRDMCFALLMASGTVSTPSMSERPLAVCCTGGEFFRAMGKIPHRAQPDQAFSR
jgi:hypothetical protein